MTPKPVKQKRGLVAIAKPHGSTPAPFTVSDAAAIQALSTGKANDGQQKVALKWILESACALPLWPYSENQRETDIGLGRHFVGQQIVGLMKVNTSKLREESNG